MLMKAEESVLLVVDVQERLVPAIHDHGSIVDGIEWLMGVAHTLSVPVRVTEQYPAGLGHTVEQLSAHLPRAVVAEKTAFACTEDPPCLEGITEPGRRQMVVCGTEAHVCVLQSAVGLQAAGHEVFVVGDAVGSRSPSDRDLALARMRSLGVQVVSREMVAFEWLHRAGTEQFRAVSRNFLR